MSAAICMSTYGDPEDDPPHVHLRAMPNDAEDRETTDTLMPPTDREAPTSPDAARAPLLPPPTADSMFLDAVKQIVQAAADLRETRREIADGFRDQGGKLDEMARESTANHGLLAGEFKTFRAVIEARMDDGERRFDAIEKQLEKLELRVTEAEDIAERSRRHAQANKEQVEVLRKELERLRATGPAETV